MDKPKFLENVMKLGSKRYYIERIRDVPEHEEVIGYARLSTTEQAYNTNALINQRARLVDAGVSLVIIDIKTGKSRQRAGLKEMMRRVREGRAKEIVVTRLDRLGRTVLIIRENIEIISTHGVNLIVIDQQIDLKSPAGMFLVNMLASLAELEVHQTGQRIHDVKAHRQSKNLACDYPPFGYVTEDGKYKLNRIPYLCLLEHRPTNYLALYDEDAGPITGLTIKELARDCIEIFLRAKGGSPAVNAITQKYGLGFTQAKKFGGNIVFYWSAAGLKRWLTNPVLLGHTAYQKRKQLPDGRRVALPPEQWQVIENTHLGERLLTEAQAAEIKRILDFSKRWNGSHLYNKEPNQSDAYTEFAYQRGLIYCDQCGQLCSATSRYSVDGRTAYRYYYCKNRRRGCENRKGVRRDLIERALIEHLLQQSFESTDEQPQAEQMEASNPHQEKLARLETKLQQLEEIEGFDPVIEEAKAKTQKEIERISNPFHPETLPHQTVRELIEAGNGLLLWHALSADEKVEVYPCLIKRITINNGDVVNITFNRPDATVSEIEALEAGGNA